MFERILFPTDFSEVSLYSLYECIPGLFEMGAKELKILHVAHFSSGDSAKEKAREKLKEIMENLRKKGIECSYALRSGETTDEILREAFQVENGEIETKVDLIVIPSKGRNILREMLIGSTARNVVRKSRIPVLLLKYNVSSDGTIEGNNNCSKLFERPLFALDLSICSDSVMEASASFKEFVKEGILYHTVDYGRVEEIKENMEQAERQLSKFEKNLPFPTIKKVEKGEASENIMRLAEELKPTLIVVGKLGRSFLDEILIGSTTNSLIRKSREPVLVIPC